ncbi:MAG: hypothetical protein HY820_20065 [Acidobacteria bacterium]|nr:hypothetical protein [Acidobacteriota bacterium]
MAIQSQRRDHDPDTRFPSRRYASYDHPSVEQLMAEQGTGPVTDVSQLHGDCWPEEESIEEFLDALHEWRGQAGPTLLHEETCRGHR